MRVLVVSAWEPDRLTDGSLLVLHHHLHRLADRHELTVLTPTGPTGATTLPESVRRPAVETARRPPALDYLSRRVGGLRRGEPAHVGYVARPGLLAALRRELATRPPDVVHLFGWGTAALWPQLAGRAALHVPVDPWAATYANRRLPGWRRVVDAGERRRVAAHERRHYPRLGAVAVVTEADAALLRTAVPHARVVVVPNGVEAGPVPPPPPPEPVVGFSGAFETAANVDAALLLARSVLPRLRAAVPDARLLLAGRDPPPSLRRLAGPAVEVTGTVPRMRAALERMTVYAAPMVSGRGVKNKILEAMAAARPVVATPLGLAGIGAGPGVLAAADPAEMAGVLAGLLADPARSAALGRAGRERVLADFGWEASAARVERLWQRLAAAGVP